MNKLEEIKGSVAVPGLRADLYILPQKNFDWLICEIERLMRLRDSAEELVAVWKQKDICGRLRKAEAQLKDAEYRWQRERERVMKAKAERTNAIRDATELRIERDKTADELSACKERAGKLQEIFNRYGQHLPNCALPEQKCDCGFHETLVEDGELAVAEWPRKQGK